MENWEELSSLVLSGRASWPLARAGSDVQRRGKDWLSFSTWQAPSALQSQAGAHGQPGKGKVKTNIANQTDGSSAT
jgi:hypothetical protein